MTLDITNIHRPITFRTGGVYVYSAKNDLDGDVVLGSELAAAEEAREAVYARLKEELDKVIEETLLAGRRSVSSPNWQDFT